MYKQEQKLGIFEKKKLTFQLQIQLHNLEARQPSQFQPLQMPISEHLKNNTTTQCLQQLVQYQRHCHKVEVNPVFS